MKNKLKRGMLVISEIALTLLLITIVSCMEGTDYLIQRIKRLFVRKRSAYTSRRNINKYGLFLFLPWIAFSTASLKAQVSNKDSVYALSEAQRRFVAEKMFALSECDSVSKSLVKENLGLREVVKQDEVLFKVNAEQLNLAADRLSSKDGDIAFLNDRLKVKDKKIRTLKFGLFSLGVASIVTNVYLLNIALK